MTPTASFTNTERVLWLLRHHRWVCGSDFLDPEIAGRPMVRYSARIHELRQRGYQIERRSCADPAHRHRSRMFEWRLVAEPDATGQIRFV